MARTLRERGKVFTLPSISANGLKQTGAVLLCVYYLGAAVVQRGILGMDRLSVQEFQALLSGNSGAMGWATLAVAAALIGVLAAPIFALLTVEGVLHTGKMGRYVLGVLLAALAAEVPFDLAMSGQVLNMREQNGLWTVLIALLMLWLMKTFDGKEAVHWVLRVLFTATGCVWAILLNCNLGGDSSFGWGFILLVAIFYAFRDHKLAKLLLALAVSLYVFATGALGLVPVALYSGERRPVGRSKYLYYAFYPLLMVLFALWTAFGV